MELQEMLDVQPEDYLKKGFLTESEAEREELNGFFSLAMAYRLREEGKSLESVRKVLDEMILIAGLKGQKEAIQEIEKSSEVRNSPCLKNLIHAATPWILQHHQWNAFLNHFRRIIAQQALVSVIPALHES